MVKEERVVINKTRVDYYLKKRKIPLWKLCNEYSRLASHNKPGSPLFTYDFYKKEVTLTMDELSGIANILKVGMLSLTDPKPIQRIMPFFWMLKRLYYTVCDMHICFRDDCKDESR